MTEISEEILNELCYAYSDAFKSKYPTEWVEFTKLDKQKQQNIKDGIKSVVSKLAEIKLKKIGIK